MLMLIYQIKKIRFLPIALKKPFKKCNEKFAVETEVRD